MTSHPLPAANPAMKMILSSTTKRLAALLGLAHVALRASALRAKPLHCAPRRHAALPADASRIPAYLRRRRLQCRAPSRFDAQTAERRREAPR